MNTYLKLLNKYDNRSCFILAAGPSLYSCMQNSFFKDLQKHGVVITVNSAVMAFPKFDYWISNDSLCRNWSWFSLVLKGKGIKVVRNSWLKFKKELDGFLYFMPRSTSEDIINPDDVGLCYCSSVPSSIDLSIQCGFKKIFLLGVDQCLDKKTNRRYFWEFLEKKSQPKQLRPAIPNFYHQKKVFKYNDMAYKALEKFAEYKNIKVYNCNVDSKVEIFEKIKFKNIERYL